jgi:hypothetical protein
MIARAEPIIGKSNNFVMYQSHYRIPSFVHVKSADRAHVTSGTLYDIFDKLPAVRILAVRFAAPFSTE